MWDSNSFKPIIQYEKTIKERQISGYGRIAPGTDKDTSLPERSWIIIFVFSSYCLYDYYQADQYSLLGLFPVPPPHGWSWVQSRLRRHTVSLIIITGSIRKRKSVIYCIVYLVAGKYDPVHWDTIWLSIFYDIPFTLYYQLRGDTPTKTRAESIHNFRIRYSHPGS